ncbi:MAG: hypothetical protein A2806_04690 [Candidatus Terrybacteria bacterium RIFCSPHIGHO2_01_FULL_48_17]|uniref:Prepilin-type N-terminal cleavage/methylation domain-containing protein n=1 Tax=Candidatus Terrybacteria bacterium RIFCSPHIGHO2_01_FULL_48_17 TaxID=1802362 RepID=A0A1G2PKW1_9BACT|nr:MAG: hypothetical protein A2806_04690 [Candidatus Terrybacteria bacterium RIFCSPHIGHO2_01_FULL_48_17]OHA52095.1 MAG: hypothetical protein A3A30_04295 [Candidatus Terrybacteria bacterium RIFCSPLOWO2_01_FULL_48_14]
MWGTFFNNTSKRGFTIIELVISTGLLVLLLGGFTIFLVLVMNSFRAGHIREELVSQGNGVLLALAHEARDSDRVYKPTTVLNNTLGQISFETAVAASSEDQRTYVDYYVDNDVLYKKIENVDPIPLTSENIKVSAFEISQICPSYQILLTLAPLTATSRVLPQTLRTSITPRFQSACARTQEISFSYGAQSGPGGSQDVQLFNNAILDGDALSSDDLEVNSGTQLTGNGYYVDSVTTNGTVGGIVCQIGAGGCAVQSLPSLPGIDFQMFQDAAEAGGVYSGDLVLNDEVQTLGPLKIEGDLRLSGDSEVILSGPLWITDDLSVNNTSTIRLSESFGSHGTVVVVNDHIDFCCDTHVEGTGQADSGFILLASLENGTDATTVDFTQNADAGERGILYARNFVRLTDFAKVAAAAGREVTLHQSAQILYTPVRVLLGDAEFAAEL